MWYNDELRTAEEVDLFFRMFKYGNFSNLPETTLFYRQCKESTSLRDPKATFFNTFKIRRIATKFYDYKPSLKAKLMNLAQLVIVSLLPSPLIYPVFATIRGMVSLKIPYLSIPTEGVSLSTRKTL